MGLTKSSVGFGAIDKGMFAKKVNDDRIVVALAGNPNVGKSTVFNGLTGMKQHTGNWEGKTVASAVGTCRYNDRCFSVVDIPGTYSLVANSAEEEVARDFICFGSPDVSVVVCDATCLERSLGLALQVMEVCEKTIVCVNLLDEAKKKGIKIDTELLSDRLGVPVVGVVARKKKSLLGLLDLLCESVESGGKVRLTRYREEIEREVEALSSLVEKLLCGKINSRWVALRLIEDDRTVIKSVSELIGFDILCNKELFEALCASRERLGEAGFGGEKLRETVATTFVRDAEEICDSVVEHRGGEYVGRDEKIDRVLTSRRFGYPIMLGFLAVIFFITISGANAVSELISSFLFYIQEFFAGFLLSLKTPAWLYSLLVDGIYRVLSWVISVMLPPMAIFFPLFTILEDVGYLPRIAYNLDKPFSRCSACGKQALTMCMGFGCNAAGVVGCRIIDSPRERLLATLTNSFVPCNGKFPMLLALISMFFVGTGTSIGDMILSAVMLTLVILLGVAMTFLCTWLLSKTVLCGAPSSFVLVLPPYRRPQVVKILWRSVFDRTIFVLGRAAAIAAPAGLIIWIMANVSVGGESLLYHTSAFLDPFARLMGLDGVILVAFILGLPANEIVVPIIIMAYLSEGSISDIGSIERMREIFVANGWDIVTAGSVILFSLLHSPCTTTLMTIKKETGSFKWVLVSALLPTAAGTVICILFASLARLIF